MPRTGIEPVTHRFSVCCSTVWAIWAKRRAVYRQCSGLTHKWKEMKMRFTRNLERERDLNPRPSAYEADELPDCYHPASTWNWIWTNDLLLMREALWPTELYRHNDPEEIRTPDSTVKGWRLNRLPTGPYTQLILKCSCQTLKANSWLLQ